MGIITEQSEMTCPTGKACFASAEDAENRLEQIKEEVLEKAKKEGKKRKEVGRFPKRSYKCDFCSWFHQTSKSKKEFRKNKALKKNDQEKAEESKKRKIANYILGKGTKRDFSQKMKLGKRKPEKEE